LSTSAGVAGANATHFVLVNGASYADALSAAALAGTKQGSIILLPADGTISATATARMALATNITVVGGYSALPATVETTMKTLRPAATISRIGGVDRYATAAAVAQNILTANIAAVNGKKSAFLASGTSFADAVIAAPGAYAGPTNSVATAVVPIMLTATDSLSAPTKAQMSLLGIKQVFVLGGTAVVSEATAAEVTALGISVIRLSGANRYATAVAIADKFTALTTAGGWGFDDDDIGLVNLEQSGGGADALAASAYLGQSNAPALGAGANGLSSETSAWLTAHNGATGVAKIHAIGGTSAVTAAQLTAADAAGTIAGPVATIAASPGQSAVVISFSQTVTATSAVLSTGYQIMGAATLAGISGRAYSTTKNQVTLTLDNPLKTGDIVRVNAGIVKTAAGLTVGLTDTTVGLDTTIPTCTVYASTGNDDILITCDELVKQVGTLDNDVDTKVTVGGVALGTASALGSGGAALSTASKTVAIDDDANFTSTGAAIVIQKDLLMDLAGNKVPALTGTVITDTTKPTVVGLPTYTLTNVATAQTIKTNIMLVAKAAGIGGHAISWTSTDDNSAGSISVTGKAITFLGNLDASHKTNVEVCALVNAHADASALVTCYIIAGSGNFTSGTDASLAGGTTKLTVTTTFSEAVTVPNSADIRYDANADNSNFVNLTQVCVANVCTGTATLDGTTHQVVPAVNTSKIAYTADTLDLALNALTATTKLISAP
jgi:putative cell wall-binding protein